MKHDFTYENLKDFLGQDPTLDGIICLLGDCEMADEGSISGSVGPIEILNDYGDKIDETGTIGFNIERNHIELVEIGENDSQSIGSIHFLTKQNRQALVEVLQAYLLTNEGCLEPAEETKIAHLIELF